MSKYEQVSFDSNNQFNKSPERKGIYINNPYKFARGLALVALLSTSIGIGADHLVEKSTGSTIPEHFNDTAVAAVELIKNEETYSDQTSTYRAEYGDTVWGLTKENLAGVNNVDIRKAIDHIQSMPENADTFSDSVLQEGESITIPDSVE